MRPTPLESISEDRLTYGAVHLNITDMDRSLVFWRDLLGLAELGTGEDGAVRLGVADAELVVLHPGATQPVQRGYSGLYHLAFHMPSEAEFARVLARLLAARHPVAPSDHITHWAFYFDDPDGINIEVAFETIDRLGSMEIVGGRPQLLDSEGRQHAMTEPLGLEEVFSFREDEDLARPMPEGTRIGHVHLYVADVEAAKGFYEEVGFSVNMDATGIGFADFSLGGTFPHRIATNIWQGAGAPQTPAGTAGMHHFELNAPGSDGAAIEQLVDPAGNVLHLRRQAKEPSG